MAQTSSSSSVGTHQALTMLALLLSLATTVHGEDNDTNDPSEPSLASSEYELVEKDNKGATVFLTFSLLLGFALFGMKLRIESFSRTQDLSAFRRGTYEAVSLLELPPGDYNTSGNHDEGVENDNEENEEEEESYQHSNDNDDTEGVETEN